MNLCRFLLKQGKRGEFTSSWTHQRCDRDGRWSWCADRAHADWKERRRRRREEELKTRKYTYTDKHLKAAKSYFNF